jgi:ribosomal protein S18 acetylase RimI-like enzyme
MTLKCKPVYRNGSTPDDSDGNQIGVLDFVPETTKGIAFLSLLMIAQKHRRKGHGQAIVSSLASFLKCRYGTRIIESGVQTNNDRGMRFWRKCGFEIGRNARALEDKTAAYDMKKRIASNS